jgi:hypothetical protein
MREFHLDNLDSVNTCCGIYELYGFSFAAYEYSKEKEPLTDEEWFYALSTVWDYRTINLPPIVLFSGTRRQEKGVFGPQQFANWLHDRNECVDWTAQVPNTNTRNKIRAYLWTPSKEFNKKYKRFLKTLDESTADKKNNDD